ncbi:hypothetical protein XNC1_3214 [Xenorhabdus nematophila ATCC 19061]|uniref:Uncharacterized protein n=1 Tax=Xenorhabdus nematophila (strain ATCC 19061 / DSM 3370 / CCUG 14189 / LMG 1036 / NCIMB 9965 / AN6) TaxID=406817 RepID=D3VLE0_XENNA|nr:hypothetical protein XNC1_3214 [Xenorhabdus nematophila ATCC 19061]
MGSSFSNNALPKAIPGDTKMPEIILCGLTAGDYFSLCLQRGGSEYPRILLPGDNRMK